MSDSERSASSEQLLHDILAAVYNAGIWAHERMQSVCLDEMKEYFNEDGTAKTIRLNGADIPIYTLVNHRSMAIDEMKVKFQVSMEGMSQKEGAIKKILRLDFGGRTSRMADVEITFKGGEPPEGIARVNNKLIKQIPV
jgi:hypothetical protein